MKNSVLDWLENSAKEMPDQVAIVDERGRLTYSEYRCKSLALARAIIEKKRRCYQEASCRLSGKGQGSIGFFHGGGL